MPKPHRKRTVSRTQFGTKLLGAFEKSTWMQTSQQGQNPMFYEVPCNVLYEKGESLHLKWRTMAKAQTNHWICNIWM